MAEGFGQFPGFRELTNENLERLVTREFAESGLSELEQLVFGLRYNLIEGDFGDPTRTLSAVSDHLQIYTGRILSEETIASLLERAEAKITTSIWATINRVLEKYLAL